MPGSANRPVGPAPADVDGASPDTDAVAPSATDPLSRAVTEAARLLESDGAIVYLVDETDGRLRFAYDAGITDGPGRAWARTIRLEIGAGMFGLAVATGQVGVTGDYPTDERFRHIESTDRLVEDLGIRSIVVAPLAADGRVFGALGTFSTQRNAYGPQDVALVRALADHAAVAHANARLIEELDRSRRELADRALAERTLREIAIRLNQPQDPAVVIQQTVDEAARLLRGVGARIDLIDAERQQLRWAYQSGGSRPTPDVWPEDSDDSLEVGVSGRSVRDRRVVWTGDYLADDRFVHRAAPDAYVRNLGLRSVMAAPLTAEGEPFGSLTVFSTEPDAWDDDDASRLAALASQASTAMSTARRIAELDRSRADLARRVETEQALRRIAARLPTIHDPGDLLQLVVDEAARLVRADGAVLDLLDPERAVLRWAYDNGIRGLFTPDEVADLWISVGVGATGVAVAEDRVVMAGKQPHAEFPDSHANDRFFEATGFRSMIISPITGKDGPLGALEVYSTREDAFDEGDAALIRALADQAAVAIGNARLIEEIERARAATGRRADQERALREIAARIAALRDPEEILERVVQASSRLLGADGAHLTRMVDDGTALQPLVVAGGMDPATEAWLKDLRFPLGGGVNGNAALLGTPYWTEDYAADTRIPQEPSDHSVASRLGLRGMAAVPLRAPGGRTIGTLAVSYAEPHAFADEELELLSGLADHAAIALHNIDLYGRLEQSEQRYRHLVENSPDLIWEIAADGTFAFLSDTCERLTGWRPEELIGQHFGAFIHATSREVAEIDWTATMTGPQTEIRGRVNLLHRDGRPIPAEFIASGRLGDDGRFAGANGSVRDMTERDRLERELRDSEARYRTLSQSSPDLVFATDADGRYVFMNDRGAEVLGWRPEDLLGHHFSEFVAPASGEAASQSYRAVLADPSQVIRSQVAFVDAGGREVPLEIHVTGNVENGVLTSIHGVARDIRERERLERELRDSEARYRFLLENSPDVVFSTDRAGTFAFLSDGIVGLTGYTPAEVVGRHFNELIHADSIADSEARWREVNEDPSVVQQAVIDLRSKSGARVPVEVKSTGIVDEDGRFAGLHGSARDISERVRLEQDLRRQAAELAASDERAHLARELHDSVTQALFSMTLVSRTVELLLDRDPSAARNQLATLRDLQREALAEMRALIFELRPGNLEENGLIPSLRTHSAALQGRIGLPILVDSRIEGRLPIEIENVLYRIAQEALHNVVKHAGARQVRIGLARAGGGVRLTITDDGRGFDPGTVPDGHMGLTGMRARAERIGAAFGVESIPGEGTTITITVPETALAAPPGPPLKTAAGGRRESAE